MTPDVFRSHLFWILDWWKDFIDWENGGVFVYPKTYKKGVEHPGKVLLMHLRQLYNYSVGIEQGHQASTKIAEHLYDTLDRVFPDRQGELFIEDGVRGIQGKIISGYNSAYAVIGLSRYAIATGSSKAATRALKIYEELDSFFTDDPLKERGTWYIYSRESGELHGKADNPLIHRCEAVLLLYRALTHTSPQLAEEKRNYLTDQCQNMITYFEQNIARPAEGYTVEKHEDDGTPSRHQHYQHQSLAHGFEWLGFLSEIEHHFDLKIPFLRHHGALLGRTCLDNGLAENGCFRNQWVPAYQSAPMSAEFWPQVEAILGSLWCRHRWGEQTFPMEEAKRMMSFYTSNMFKPEELGGGILTSVSENGVPCSMRTGSSFKCDHHAVRMCEKILEYPLLAEST